MTTKLPRKLKQDAITEAVFEVRFQTEDADELVLGRLLDIRAWRDWRKTRSPIADFPAPFRSQVDRFRHQPLYEVRDQNNRQVVKVGPNVISCHVLAQYPGWRIFSGLISKAVTGLFSNVESIEISRLGLRYINALTSERHFIPSAYDLFLDVTVRDARPSDNININYTVKEGRNMEALVRISSPSLVSGTIPSDTTAYVDVDIRTTDSLGETDRQAVMTWVRDAHRFEKRQFFSLLPDEVIERLKE